MKNIILFTCLLVCLISFNGISVSQDVNGPSFEFEEIKHDFGDIQQGEKVTYAFKFNNSGSEPLIISNVITTCGCTAPTWPKEPILTNEKGELKIVFNSTGKIGKQNKVITILSNSVNQKDRIIITANVLPKN